MRSVDLEKIGKYVDVPEAARFLLERPEKKVIMNLNVRTGADKLMAADCYIVYHNTARGPAKGGIRVSPGVTLAETEDLAERMTWKTALVRLPFGGGKTGIAIDGSKLTMFERINLFHEFVHIARSELTTGAYVPAPDMGSGPSDMAVIFGETHMLECVTGKPPRVGGLPGRLEATGRGVAFAARLALEKFVGRGVKGVTVAVQGFGNVGGWTAQFLSEWGAKVVAIGDVSGAVRDGDGLDVGALKQAVAAGGAVSDWHGEKLTNEELLGLEVDCLIPAAVERVLTEETAGSVRAKLVVEGANGPTTPGGDAVLEGNGVKVVPDILANAGGVIASYIEWRKAKSGSITGKEEVFRSVEELIGATFAEVCGRAEEMKVTHRLAAQVSAVGEVVGAMEDRGWL